jgi:hypothetical protein
MTPSRTTASFCIAARIRIRGFSIYEKHFSDLEEINLKDFKAHACDFRDFLVFFKSEHYYRNIHNFPPFFLAQN